jgi:hypothetical protein
MAAGVFVLTREMAVPEVGPDGVGGVLGFNPARTEVAAREWFLRKDERPATPEEEW